MKRYFAVAALVTSAALASFAQRRPGVVEKNTTVLGFTMHYLEAGRGAPVVLLHELGGDGSRWTPNIEPLVCEFLGGTKATHQ